MQALSNAVDASAKWLYKHRYKICAAGAVAVGAVAAYRYYYGEEEEPKPKDAKEEKARRTRTLLRARQEFDFALLNFLPTLKKKVSEHIDVSASIRKIKQIKNARRQGQEVEAEFVLWEEVKVQTFSLLFTSVFMVCALVSLLKVQFHILAKGSPAMASQNNELEDRARPHSHKQRVYANLLGSTYNHVLGVGLAVCAERVQTSVRDTLADWHIESKLAVTYEELINVIAVIRAQLQGPDTRSDNDDYTPPSGDISAENGMEFMDSASTSIARAIIQPSPSTATGDSDEHAETKTDTETTANAHVAGDHEADFASSLLAQTWDVVDSSVFEAAFNEAVDSCFVRVFAQLRSVYDNMHTRDQAQVVNQVGNSEAPPLAQLVPQIRSLALAVLDVETENHFVRSISSGPTLELLCTAVFDAQTHAAPSQDMQV